MVSQATSLMSVPSKFSVRRALPPFRRRALPTPLFGAHVYDSNEYTPLLPIGVFSREWLLTATVTHDR